MRRLLVVLVVAVVVAGAVAGAPSWAQKGPIKVGLLVPQTGPLAANGKDMINGFELPPGSPKLAGSSRVRAYTCSRDR